MSRFDLSEYEPVEDRLARFHTDHPEGRVLSDLVSHGDGTWIVKATEAFDTETGEVVPGVSVKTASPTLQVRGDKNAKGAMRAALVETLGLPAELAGGDA